MRKVLVGISGASGMPVARIFMQMLSLRPDIELSCVPSKAALLAMRHESSEDASFFRVYANQTFNPDDLAAGPASGTWWDSEASMVVIPCSMNTLGSLAAGCSSNLLQRAASVALKEGRKLVLVTRETPLSRINIHNMLLLKDAGAVLMPFSPAFYFHPQTIDELLTHFCWHLMDQLGLGHAGKRWS